MFKLFLLPYFLKIIIIEIPSRLAENIKMVNSRLSRVKKMCGPCPSVNPSLINIILSGALS